MTRRFVSVAKTRTPAHAALRSTTTTPGAGIASAVRHVTTYYAQELGELRAFALRALGLLVTANEQLNFPAALLTGIFVQRHQFRLPDVRNALYMDTFDVINKRL